ncbi:uncharacterized protein LOC119658336 isoform X1 [Hermetia illucens]|uniref:uncharacterized protein LOC119658336 isoform X1 n=1 Tax=Hermetia illucens TaxID=343691 RepID=UPI0018CC2468|nr:uncharacterized protein LOC119658336 isoform X1 [Hermetia illucens]
MPWIKSNIKKPLPKNAIVGGRDLEGNSIYLARTHVDEYLLPCYVIPKKEEAWTSLNGKAIAVTDYEVLAGDSYRWVKDQDGNTPGGALIGGKAFNGEQLFIGRVAIEKGFIPGAVWPSKKGLYVAYDESERFYAKYEVLVIAGCDACSCNSPCCKSCTIL